MPNVYGHLAYWQLALDLLKLAGLFACMTAGVLYLRGELAPLVRRWRRIGWWKS